jgi:NitT/TauT family transport system ATP-binding protein
MDKKALKLLHLHVKYGSGAGGHKALHDISFGVDKGEFVSIVGPSGCGKTTLLSVIAGLLPATIGKIEVKDAVVGFVFQEPNLLPWRTVIDNVVLPLEIKSDGSGKKYYQKARTLLKMVGLEKYETAYPHELSGGMKQKVAIARALVHNPSLLLMDEPTSSLDEITKTGFNIELNGIWRKTRKTILYVTHNIPEAAFLSTKVVVLTPAPGSIKRIIDIDLPRKRDEFTLKDRRYFDSITKIRGVLKS